MTAERFPLITALVRSKCRKIPAGPVDAVGTRQGLLRLSQVQAQIADILAISEQRLQNGERPQKVVEIFRKKNLHTYISTGDTGSFGLQVEHLDRCQNPTWNRYYVLHITGQNGTRHTPIAARWLSEVSLDEKWKTTPLVTHGETRATMQRNPNHWLPLAVALQIVKIEASAASPAASFAAGRGRLIELAELRNALTGTAANCLLTPDHARTDDRRDNHQPHAVLSAECRKLPRTAIVHGRDITSRRPFVIDMEAGWLRATPTAPINRTSIVSRWSRREPDLVQRLLAEVDAQPPADDTRRR